MHKCSEANMFGPSLVERLGLAIICYFRRGEVIHPLPLIHVLFSEQDDKRCAFI